MPSPVAKRKPVVIAWVRIGREASLDWYLLAQMLVKYVSTYVVNNLPAQHLDRLVAV
jgi:hypothetical protein